MAAPENIASENAIKKNLQLQEIIPSDLEDIARFIGRVSPSRTPLARAVERLAWILLENPARAPGDPLGWILRAASREIVGCMCCAAQKFCIGQTTFTLMMANSFFVDDQYRGSGTSIFLKYLQLASRCPLFVSSANPTVAEMWRKLGGYSLANSDHELFAVVRRSPLVEESVHRKLASDRIARFASALASPLNRARRQLRLQTTGGQLSPLGSPEEAASLCAEHRSEKITNFRDARFLKWRYFSNVCSMARLFSFRPREPGTKQFVVGVDLQNRGYRQQIRALHVLDIWGEADPKTCFAIASCLWREYREQIDMLVFRCLDSAQEQLLTEHGFRLRPFAAPVAWCLDKYQLLPPKVWYFVPADGDMFL
jgi:hypothetical protein